MKKIRLIIMVAGVMALAITAGLTYAWFTSEAAPANLTVNTARINIATASIKEDLSLKLPGEMAGFSEWTLTNNSTRESIVEFSISAADIEYKDGATPPLSDERKAQLLSLLNDPDNIMINGISAGKGVNTVFKSPVNGNVYVYLNANGSLSGGDQLDGAFSLHLRVPRELGGNVTVKNSEVEPVPDEEGGIPEDRITRTPDRQEEHEAIITLKCHAYAIQGTRDAALDIFGSDVAVAFFGSDA